MNFSKQFLEAMDEAKAARLNCVNHIIVLMHLSTKDNGDIPSRLADVAKVSSAAITGMLDTLETMNLVERERSEQDRRSYRVHITSKGLETIARMLP